MVSKVSPAADARQSQDMVNFSRRIAQVFSLFTFDGVSSKEAIAQLYQCAQFRTTLHSVINKCNDHNEPMTKEVLQRELAAIGSIIEQSINYGNTEFIFFRKCCQNILGFTFEKVPQDSVDGTDPTCNVVLQKFDEACANWKNKSLGQFVVEDEWVRIAILDARKRIDRAHEAKCLARVRYPVFDTEKMRPMIELVKSNLLMQKAHRWLEKEQIEGPHYTSFDRLLGRMMNKRLLPPSTDMQKKPFLGLGFLDHARSKSQSAALLPVSSSEFCQVNDARVHWLVQNHCAKVIARLNQASVEVDSRVAQYTAFYQKITQFRKQRDQEQKISEEQLTNLYQESTKIAIGQTPVVKKRVGAGLIFLGSVLMLAVILDVAFLGGVCSFLALKLNTVFSFASVGSFVATMIGTSVLSTVAGLELRCSGQEQAERKIAKMQRPLGFSVVNRNMLYACTGSIRAEEPTISSPMSYSSSVASQ